MFTAEKLISIATAELGYKEKKSNSQLDSKTANAGSNNWQKYGRDLNKAGYYNGNKNGYEWCDQFVDWCFLQLTGDKKTAEAMECQTGNLGAGCGYSMRYYEAQGRFDKSPKVGDQIFFRYSGDSGADHTGIVTEVTAKQIVTIEGNKNNQVSKCTYDRSYYAILGYGHPKYDVENGKEQPKKESAAPTKASTSKEVKTVKIELNVLKAGSTGAQVKNLQRLLKQRGWKDAAGNVLAIDGDFGSKTTAAVKKFQKNFGITVDGVVGEKTWEKLLKS